LASTGEAPGESERSLLHSAIAEAEGKVA
jgi:hypothetical protein